MKVTFLVILLTGAASATELSNSQYLNSQYLNSQYLNSQYLNSQYLNSETLDSGSNAGQTVTGFVNPDGSLVQYVGLSNSTFTGYNWLGYWQYVSGQDFVGKWVQSTVSDGSIVWLYLNGMQTTGTGVSLYQVWAWVDQWQPLCGYDANGSPIMAMPIRGQWDYSQGWSDSGGRASDDPNSFTFACVDTAIGKCAASGVTNTMGYAPYASDWYYKPDANGVWHYVDGKQFHQSCVRMVRADYCGDGRSYTQSGNPIDVTDWLYYHRNVQTHNNVRNEWGYEATWDVSGAAHMTCSRDGGYTSMDMPKSCPAVLMQTPFGPRWTSGRTLVWSCFPGTDQSGLKGDYYMPVPEQIDTNPFANATLSNRTGLVTPPSFSF